MISRSQRMCNQYSAMVEVRGVSFNVLINQAEQIESVLQDQEPVISWQDGKLKSKK